MTNLVIVFKVECVCVLLVSYSKCARNAFTVEESPTLSPPKYLPEYLECYLFLYTDYCVQCFPFQINIVPPVAGTFTVTASIWNFAHLQVTTELPL